ncbi:MAG: hypothetical protein WBD64_11615 [Candidatus Zixiibacteriota bacterium]
MLRNCIRRRTAAVISTQAARNMLRCFGIQVLLLTVISCSSKHDAGSNFPPIEFDVNPDLLSSPLLIDTSFSIRMPFDWPEVNGESFKAAKQVINGDTSSVLSLELLEIFKSVQGASCVISKVINETPLFDLLDTDFEESLKSNFRTDEVSKGAFSLNGNNTIQYRVISRDIVAFKLFCEISGNLYQIDYFIPKGIYEVEVRKVESSLGSITTNEDAR